MAGRPRQKTIPSGERCAAPPRSNDAGVIHIRTRIRSDLASGTFKSIIDPQSMTDSKSETADSNPWAASVRIKAKSMSRAYGQRRHDYRIGRQPNYVDCERTVFNRALVEPRPLPEIRNEIERLRERADAKRALKSNAAIVTTGIITFGFEAAKVFDLLPAIDQDGAFHELADAIARKLGTTLEGLVVHLDETTIHAHFELRAYTDDGVPVSKVATSTVLSDLQDLTAEMMSAVCPEIERGHRKWDRIAAGADYADTLNRSVKQLHEDLPREIAEREAAIEALELKAVDLKASIEKTKHYIQKLRDREELNERETKRLATYEIRLAKKKAAQSELAGKLKEARAHLQSRNKAVETREQLVEKAASAASGRSAEAEASLAAVELVLDEIADGTARVEDGVITMNDNRWTQLAPQPVVSRLTKVLMRYLRREAFLTERLRKFDVMIEKMSTWLRRPDLPKAAREEAKSIIVDGTQMDQS